MVRCSFGHTVYRCDSCDLDAWGAAKTYHEAFQPGHTMTPIGFHSFNRFTSAWEWRSMDGKKADYPAREVAGLTV